MFLCIMFYINKCLCICVFISEKGSLFVQFILADHIILYFFHLKGQRIEGEYKSRIHHFVLQ